MDLIKRFKKIHSKFKYTQFKNYLPYSQNLLHLFYDGIAKSKFYFSNGMKFYPSNKHADEIKKFGYSFFGDCKEELFTRQLVEKVNMLYKSQYVDKNYEKEGLLRIKDCLVHLPEMEQIVGLPKIQEVLYSYYQSNFYLFNVDVYRTLPSEENIFGSLLWHCDSVPQSQVKLMFFLSDTSKETGAMQIIKKDRTDMYRRRGFLGRSDGERFSKEFELECDYVEGLAGQAAFFTPQFCVHRAVRPKKKLRDVIVFMFHSSVQEMRPLREEEKKYISNTFTYPKNPFTKNIKTIEWKKY